MHEDNNTEYKREYAPDIKKEVIAFANSDGGVIYVGRDDEGNPYSLPDIDETLTQITNSILPDVTMLVGYEASEKGIAITVREGTHKPYFLPEKGLKPSGVYVRQMRSAFDFLSLSNNLAATFSGLDRIEQYDYPEEVVREAMLNAIIREMINEGMIAKNGSGKEDNEYVLAE